VLLGASSRLTCQQFNALEDNVREGALSWGYGYISGWQEVKVLLAERASEDPGPTIKVNPRDGHAAG
jgi:hypothetical protein